MEFPIKLKLLTSACALVLSTFCVDAAATWQPVPSAGPNQALHNPAHAAVSSGTGIFALGSLYAVGSGWRVVYYVTDNPGNGWNYLDSAGGTSLTMSARGDLWLIAADEGIYHKTSAGTWVSVTTAACGGGGNISPRQVSGDNNIAVAETSNGAGDLPWVITWDGEVRRFTGICWASSPLPFGRARDIGVYSDLVNV